MSGLFSGAADTHAVFRIEEGVTFSVLNRLSSAFNTSGQISFTGAGEVNFSGNTENIFGGAVYAEGDISFSSSAVFSNNFALTGSGGALFSNNGSVYLADGTRFSGNSTANLGGGIFAAQNIEFGDSAVVENNSGGEGGALAAVGSVIFGDDAELRGNIATFGQGGAVVSGMGDIIFGDGAIVSYNTADQAGGALWSGNDIVFGDNASLTGNTSTARSGGALNAYNGVEFGNDAVIMNNTAGRGAGGVYSGIGGVTFGNNAALIGNTAQSGHGGAVSSGATASFGDNALLSGNTATGVGGAVSATDVIFGEDAEITNNSAVVSGAIYSSTSAVFGNGVKLSENTSTNGHGGAVYSDGTVSFGDNAELSGNSAYLYGGAVYSMGAVTFGNGAKIFDNTAAYGGALLIYNGAVFGDNTEFKDNTADYTAGAVYAVMGDLEFGDGAVIIDNTAGGAGALYTSAGSITFGNNAVLTGNEAESGDGGAVLSGMIASFGDNALLSDNTAFNYGGAVWAGDVIFGEDAEITNNTAYTTGAVYAYASAVFGNGVKLSENVSTGGHGGAVYSEGMVSFSDDAELSGNSAYLYGGAVYSMDAVTFGNGAKIFDNTAAYGGALLTYNGAVFGDNTEFKDNTADYTAGAVYVVSGDLEFGDGAVIMNNTAGAAGALYASAGNITFGDNASLSGNEAENGNGGAVLSGMTASFGDNALLSGNTAFGSGGAVYSGGAVSFGTEAKLSDNTAAHGGAVYSAAGDVVFGNNTSLTDNTASVSGGAVYAGGNVTFNAEGDGVTLISGNLAGGEANSIFFAADGSILTVNTEDESVVDMRDSVSVTDSASVNVVKTGSGVWKLGGVNDFGGGSLQIAEGTLYLYRENEVSNGYDSLGGEKGVAFGEISAGSVSIGENAVIAGSGTVNNTISLSGRLSPGNSIGVINMNSVVFQADSVYEVEISPDGANDLAVIAGNADLSGGSVSVLAESGNWGNFASYTILEAGSLTGEFQNISSNLAFLDPFLKYENNSVILDVYRNNASFESVTRTYNQKMISGALAGFGTDSGLYREILGMSASSARSAFDSMNGEIHATAVSAALNNSRLIRDSLTAHLIERSALRITAENSAWVKLFGFTTDTDSDGNAAKYNADGQILIGGVDFQPASSGRFGITLGFESGDVEVNDGRNSDADIKTIHFGAYGSYNAGFAEFRAGGLMGFADVETERTAEAGGFRETLNGDYKARIFQTFAEAGKRISLGRGYIMPFISAAHVYMEADSFTEDGGDMALEVSDYSGNLLTASFGLRGNVSFTDIFGLGAYAAYQHIAEGYEPERKSRFVSGGSGFDTKGLPLDRNSFIIGTDINCSITEAVNLSVGYGGSFGDYITEHHGKASISVAF
ncbi:MAG: autotransporter domain-containing protein [Deferribacterales bacterium]